MGCSPTFADSVSSVSWQQKMFLFPLSSQPPAAQSGGGPLFLAIYVLPSLLHCDEQQDRGYLPDRLLQVTFS